MKSHEAISAAIGRYDTDAHAKALRLSLSQVGKWKEPTGDYNDSGSLNPLDRIETIIATAFSLGKTLNEASAPIQYLAERFGFIVIPSPKPTGCLAELTLELLKTAKEFGDLAKESSKALEDGKLSRQEIERIHKESWELVRQTMAFLSKVKEQAR